MFRQPTPVEMDEVEKCFSHFRNFGLRILLPSPSPEHILLNRLSDHWVVAPTDGYQIGLDFAPEYRNLAAVPIPTPMIRKQPYAHCRETVVNIEDSRVRETFLFYMTPQDRESPHSIMRGRENYGIPSKWFLDREFAIKLDK